ncbi:endonuclease domain-containing protein [Devosia oryziradicis]|uniref:Endonuclease domain-containing protein n=1 Tax=Devosia oryziradicis TaxID=2801335 RepID=A0ABX7BWS8_9HYPH|nr:DUF559 domain-containing protein [Devosia oryziradicis]QQR36408.1 endonuclease domain-containing protein [Devosia oryziradicis]
MSQRPRQLRQNATDAESHLWSALRNRGLAQRKFVRQLQVGSYIADFACRELGLIIEVDGGQHAETASDEVRTAYLNAQGYSVLRFWNNEVLENLDGVASAILSAIEGSPLTRPPLRSGHPLPDGERNRRHPRRSVFTSPSTGSIHSSPHWGEVAA